MTTALHEGLMVPPEENGNVGAFPEGLWARMLAADPILQIDRRYSPLASIGSALTDSTGGTGDGTLAAIGATHGGDVSADINNNFKEVFDQLSLLRAQVSDTITWTRDNGGTVAKTAGGLRLQSEASPSANDDVAGRSVDTFAVAAAKAFGGVMRFKVSSVNASTGVGFQFGLATNSGDELFSADPADGAFFYLTPGTSALKFRVRDNSGTARDSSTLATLAADTETVIAFYCKPGTSATMSEGWVSVDGVRTAFTALQLTALYNMVATSPATLQGHIAQRVKGTTQRNATIPFAYIWAEK